MSRTMMMLKRLLLISGCLASTTTIWAHELSEQDIQNVVYQQFKPLLEQYQVAGMAVAITLHGKHYFINYGVASQQSKQAVNQNTLFELGSVSKTFNATLVGYAQAQGKLSLADHPAKYFPQLKNTAINQATLLHLGTYTVGGLPLQFPEQVNQQQDMIKYFQMWQPTSPVGTMRQYSNPSIGLMGYVTALAMKKPYAELLEKIIFPQLNLKQSFITVPEQQMANYAWGYKDGQPIRVTAGMFDAEAYGVKSSSSDMLKFLDAQINPKQLKQPMRNAIEQTHIGYFKLDGMTQGLGWEQYAYPVTLETLLQGNSSQMILEAQPVVTISSPKITSQATFFNKTGSTNGFGAYVAFIPKEQIGIVMLANKNFPNSARITAAYRTMEKLIDLSQSQLNHQ